MSQVAARYGVKLIGWPLLELKNPSEMRRDELMKVHEGLTAEEPTIYFEKLTDFELRELRKTVKSQKRARAEDPPMSAPSKRSRVASPCTSTSSYITEIDADGDITFASSASSVEPITPDRSLVFYDPTVLSTSQPENVMQLFLDSPA